jgi:hypothetical protein
MLRTIIEALRNFFGATQSVADLQRQRDAQKNSPEMKANAAAKTRAEIVKDATNAVAADDLDAIRKGAAE